MKDEDGLINWFNCSQSKRDQQIESARKAKERQELENCTFKPNREHKRQYSAASSNWTRKCEEKKDERFPFKPQINSSNKPDEESPDAKVRKSIEASVQRMKQAYNEQVRVKRMTDRGYTSGLYEKSFKAKPTKKAKKHKVSISTPQK
jgi:hypothetical protein